MRPLPDRPRTDGWFEDVFASLHGDVLRYALRRVPHDQAADVVAETFLVAWRRRDEVPREHVRQWLFRVAANVIANADRGRVRQSRLEGRLRAVPDAEDVGGVDVLRVRAALATLPAPDQEALRLIEWDGLAPPEAASVAGCSTATFRVRLHRARKRFAAAYEKLGVTP